MVRQTLWLTFWNHVLYILPSAIAQWVWQPDLPLDPIAPTLWEYSWQILVSFAIFDSYYGFIHIFMHRVSPINVCDVKCEVDKSMQSAQLNKGGRDMKYSWFLHL